jgi:hypothetical protein
VFPAVLGVLGVLGGEKPFGLILQAKAARA